MIYFLLSLLDNRLGLLNTLRQSYFCLRFNLFLRDIRLNNLLIQTNLWIKYMSILYVGMIELVLWCILLSVLACLYQFLMLLKLVIPYICYLTLLTRCIEFCETLSHLLVVSNYLNLRLSCIIWISGCLIKTLSHYFGFRIDIGLWNLLILSLR